ncbi:MAG: hypothetical protein HZB92_09340 [Euryarchaeota archaeon]|nr:hypothetical protein [Euryarchaeota archaeon]
MDGLLAVWWAVSALLYFSFPGLPAILLLKRMRLIGLADGLPLVPVASLSLSIPATLMSYFLFGARLGASTWGAVTLAITSVCTAMYLMSLRRKGERSKGHFAWAFSDLMQRARPVIAQRSAWLLLGIICLALSFTYMPHLGYPLPLHADEWHMWADSQGMMGQGAWEFSSPYYGSHVRGSAESGFIMFIGIFQGFSAMDWPTVFIVLPLILTAVGVLLAYRLGRLVDAGLATALFVAMLPTGLRFLGIGLLVPLGLAFALVLALILLLSKMKNLALLPAILTALLFLLLVHPASALTGLVAMLVFSVAHLTARRWKEGAALICACAAVLMMALALSSLWVLRTGAGGLSDILTSENFILADVAAETYLKIFGFWLFILGPIGGILLAGERKFPGLALLAITVIVGCLSLSFRYVLTRVTNVQALHDRTTFIFFGLAALPSARGATWLWRASKVTAIFALSAAVVASVYVHVATPYYHIISEEEYRDFIWIRDNLGANYTKAVLDPWKAVAFAPVTGKLVFYSTHQGVDIGMAEKISAIDAFFGGNCSDTAFLRDNGVSIVYTETLIDNPLLVEVQPRIYVLR